MLPTRVEYSYVACCKCIEYSESFVATSYLVATLVQGVPADSGNFLWYTTESIAVLETATAKSSWMLLTSRWTGSYSLM